ncbi:MAG: TIGR03085 family metal-binding protein [Nakamurella sp.]
MTEPSVTHSTVAQRERAALADLFDAVGPDHPTLDEGWVTADLLHHLLIREGRPDALVADVVKPLHFWAERVIDGYRKLPWAEQVDVWRQGPPRFSPVSITKIDSLMNTAEHFIHHEDVRRGVPGWTVRKLDAETEQAILDQVKSRLSSLQLKSLGVGVQAQLPDKRIFQIRLGDPAITLVGAPSELLLWISGRRTACDVQVQGSPAALEMVERASRR